MESLDKMHIDVTVLDPVTKMDKWRFTGFYGESRRELRFRSWERLKLLNDQSSLPWLCVGDFNEVLHASEHFGGAGRSERQMEGFREAVSVCGFTDLGFIGLPYTWDNRQDADHNIKVRLDRGLATDPFLGLYREVKVWNIQTTISDHSCLVVECLEHTTGRRRRKKNFRYENMWQRDPSYMALIRDSWDHNAGGQSLGEMQAKLKNVQSSLQVWERDVFGSVKKTLANLRCDLEAERARSIGSGPSRYEKQLMSRISELLSREEVMEKQRSRVEWLKDGDRNTSFFQAKSTARAKRNAITSLSREDGSVAATQEEIEGVATEFYANLFAAQDNLSPNLIIEHVPRKISEEMNERLTRPYTATEVERALQMMKANKAPGPDGFTAGFYQLHWDLLGQEVTAAVLNFLNGGTLSADINHTTIVLIPKTRNPQTMKEFRPISLCNVLYKICSKVLALRLREFLDEIISEEQSAFVPGRLITDNVLISYECIHYLKRKKGRMVRVLLNSIWPRLMIGLNGITCGESC